MKNRIIHTFSVSKVIVAATIPMIGTHTGCHKLGNCICLTVILGLLGSQILLRAVNCVWMI